MRALIVIPAFNEQEALPGVLEELRVTVPDLDLLVVDDGSSDDTSKLAHAADVFVLRLPFNLGVGAALRTGLRHALRHGYEAVVQLDADGQHDPQEIATLLRELPTGADLVVGSRFAAQDGNYSVGRVRGGAMRVLRFVVLVLTRRRFTDTSSGFRAFGPKAIEFFARQYPADYLGDTVEALLLAVYKGLNVIEVPVQMRHRSAGRPSNRNLKLVYHYFRLLIVMLSTAKRPVRP